MYGRSILHTVILVFGFCLATQAQIKPLEFTLHLDGKIAPKVESQLEWPEVISGELAARKVANQNINILQSNGYLASSLDSINADTNNVQVYIHVGNRFNWVRLDPGNIPPELLDDIRYPRGQLSEEVVYPSEFAAITDRVLTYFENNGYPFCEIRLINAEVTDSSLKGTLQLRRNVLFTMDTIQIVGSSETRKNFFYNYLGFKPGDIYNERRIQQIDRKLDQLPYVEKKFNTKVYFIRDKARVVLYLDERKTDRIDGVVGFAPNTNTVTNDLLLTGEVNVDLQNLAGSGKALSMHWKSFLANSSELNLQFRYPYVLKTPIGLDAKSEFQRFDTTQTNVLFNFGGQYAFGGTNFIRLFYESNFSILESIDTNRIRQSRSIPAANPVAITNYGLDVYVEHLDYKINPRKGVTAGLVLSVGRKEIERDNRIEAVKFTTIGGEEYSVYDSTDLINLQGNIRYNLQYFVPLFDKSAIVTSVSGKYLLSPQIFFNELYRIGGNNTLRGFDENAILASSFTIVNLEYRYLLSRNSHFKIFANGAYYENRSVDVERLISDFPIGFGAGVNLEVNAGLLTMAYALGTDRNSKINFSRAKIHFGVIKYL